MRAKTLSLLILGLLSVAPLITQATQNVTPSTFAVFVVSSNPKTGEAKGGVAGTAFFVGRKTAWTAAHVLNPQSFKTSADFPLTQIWLLHERHAPIEIKPSHVSSLPGQDLTRLNFSHEIVRREFVFQQRSSSLSLVQGQVETNGFLAETLGPVLRWNKGRVEISAVPRLERKSARGQISRRARVNLQAPDVQLDEAPCLQLTYQPVKGLSGGPVLFEGQVVGVNSFADPQMQGHTWAVQIPN